MSVFTGKGALGRVHAERLYAFNATLKKKAISERGYWDDNKNNHPINKWSYQKWEKQVHSDAAFLDRVDKLPPDLKFKTTKMARMVNLRMIMPLGIALYIVMCYVRYKWWGINPNEASASVMRTYGNSARLPVQ